MSRVLAGVSLGVWLHSISNLSLTGGRTKVPTPCHGVGLPDCAPWVTSSTETQSGRGAALSNKTLMWLREFSGLIGFRLKGARTRPILYCVASGYERARLSCCSQNISFAGFDEANGKAPRETWVQQPLKHGIASTAI